MAASVLDTVMSMQPKEGGGGAGETRETVVFRMADDMLDKLPADYIPHEVGAASVWSACCCTQKSRPLEQRS